MKSSLLAALALSGALLAPAHAQQACASDNPAIARIQSQWTAPATATAQSLSGGFAPVTAQLLPLAQGQERFGTLQVKSRKTMRFFSQLEWRVDQEGDYWLVADSGAWMDVKDGAQALEPLAFNHGLRCAGIHKALQFHLRPGRYQLVIASDETDRVKIAADMAQ